MTDRVVKRLAEVGVTFEPTGTSCEGALRRPDRKSPSATAREPGAPLVSCLMLSRGNLDLLHFSTVSFLRQSYPHRELVVVTDAHHAEPVTAFLRRSGVADPIVLGVDPSLTTGDRRNLCTARARGDILMVWDDDDLSDPYRIASAVATLRQSDAAATFLARLVIWWPRRELAAISARRLWEGTMAVWRAHAPIYPALQRSEDSPAVDFVKANQPVATIDAPCQYIYVVTGRNVSTAAHFETLVGEADCVLQGEDFRALTAHLARRVAVLEYQALLQRA